MGALRVFVFPPHFLSEAENLSRLDLGPKKTVLSITAQKLVSGITNLIAKLLA